MAQRTKQALAAALKKLLTRQPLDDITVKELVEECHVNRQTFYYHFQDIYDLLHFFLAVETQAVLADCSDCCDALQRVLRYAADNHMTVYHVLCSAGLSMQDDPFYALAGGVVCARPKQRDLSEADEVMLTDFCTHALAGAMADWFFRGMKEPPEMLSRRLNLLLEGALEGGAQRLAASKQAVF